MDTRTRHTKPTVEEKTQQRESKREEKKDWKREGNQYRVGSEEKRYPFLRTTGQNIDMT